ncbi:MAG TPA: hypothetical protein VM557_06660 [Thermoanaerobaculia bacterium]|nr:hypothetical protein [Thermoanaerobaculia bacterium]
MIGRAARLSFAVLFGVVLSPAAGIAAEWLHVEIREGSGERSRLRMNVPVSLVMRVAPLLPHDWSGCSLSIGRSRVGFEDLTAIWEALSSNSGARVVRDTRGGTIEAIRNDGHVLLRTRGRFDGDTVEARMPERVLRALLSGRHREMDVAAAVREMVLAGGGTLAFITSDDSRVHIWVD